MNVPLFDAADFDRMIRETKPDVVIVTTKDGTHDQYIIRAMELGCDVMTEKPMTTDEKKCRAILETQRKTGRKIIVTFNYRYSPHRTQVKDLLMSGVIGDVLSVDFHWLLDTRARGGLLPALAQPQGQFRRVDGAQGDAPFRPGELVALRRAGHRCRQRQARFLHAGNGQTPGLARVITNAVMTCPEQDKMHVLPRPRRECELQGAVPRH